MIIRDIIIFETRLFHAEEKGGTQYSGEHRRGGGGGCRGDAGAGFHQPKCASTRPTNPPPSQASPPARQRYPVMGAGAAGVPQRKVFGDGRETGPAVGAVATGAPQNGCGSGSAERLRQRKVFGCRCSAAGVRLHGLRGRSDWRRQGFAQEAEEQRGSGELQMELCGRAMWGGCHAKLPQYP
nr:uncharacterized protein LOC127292795 isoform X2 [Lolium perenne]